MNEMLYGERVHIEKLRPRYVLPDDVPPGTGSTREEFAEWSARVCGYAKPLLPDGQVYKTQFGLTMNETTWRQLQAAIKAKNKGAA